MSINCYLSSSFIYLQRPEGGSTNSLQDSGISEHEGGATGGQSGSSSPLSKLPGKYETLKPY